MGGVELQIHNPDVVAVQLQPAVHLHRAALAPEPLIQGEVEGDHGVRRPFPGIGDIGYVGLHLAGQA